VHGKLAILLSKQVIMLNKKMQAIVITKYGAPEGPQLQEVENARAA
jgi:hypothetical protein